MSSNLELRATTWEGGFIVGIQGYQRDSTTQKITHRIKSIELEEFDPDELNRVYNTPVQISPEFAGRMPASQRLSISRPANSGEI